MREKEQKKSFLTLKTESVTTVLNFQEHQPKPVKIYVSYIASDEEKHFTNFKPETESFNMTGQYKHARVPTIADLKKTAANISEFVI